MTVPANLVLACLLLAGCDVGGGYTTYREYQAACEKHGGTSLNLRNQHSVCLKREAFIEVRK